jgi:hypothetical protein
MLIMFALFIMLNVYFLFSYSRLTSCDLVQVHVLRWPKRLLGLLFVTLHYYFLLTNYYYEFELY